MNKGRDRGRKTKRRAGKGWEGRRTPPSRTPTQKGALQNINRSIIKTKVAFIKVFSCHLDTHVNIYLYICIDLCICVNYVQAKYNLEITFRMQSKTKGGGGKAAIALLRSTPKGGGASVEGARGGSLFSHPPRKWSQCGVVCPIQLSQYTIGINLTLFTRGGVVYC